MRIACLALPLLLLHAGTATATKPTPTKRSSSAYSANGLFSFHADCQTKTVQVFTKDQAKANPMVPLWTFQHDVQHDAFLVSNDGETVIVLWWPRLGLQDSGTVALRFWNRQKGEYKTHKLNALCDDFSNVGVTSMFFDNSAWFQKPIRFDEETLTVVTTDHHECRFSVRTGELLERNRVFSFWEKVLIGIVVAVLVIGGGLFALLYCLFRRKPHRERIGPTALTPPTD